MAAENTRHAKNESHKSFDGWSYDEAFCRNLGLINPKEQEKLRHSRIAIPGMGGVGGIHLVTLARMGVGAFRIADPDSFEMGNFNRQYGAELPTLHQNKAAAMAEKARAVNPELDMQVWSERITATNVREFLADVDVVVDGLDFFAFDARRKLFAEARRRGIWAVTAGPIGFSTAWLLFDPEGMSFDRYFDLHDGMDPMDQFTAFAVGLAPHGTHFTYLDLSHVDRNAARGPSVAAACHLASGVAAVEVIKILLNRGPLRGAPCYGQFDAYSCMLRKGRLWSGNRHPLQRLKRRWLRGRFESLFGAVREQEQHGLASQTLP